MDGSPEMEDFLHRSARKVGILGFGDDEKGLYLRCQLSVHQGQLELIFEIRKGSQPPDDDSALFSPHEIDQEAFEMLDPYVGKVAQGFPCHGLPFFFGEGVLLLAVVKHPHGEVAEYGGGPFGYVNVPVCNGVKGSGVHGSY